MKTKLNLLGLLVAAFVLSSFIENAKLKGFDYGKTIDGKYINSYFGLEITLPENWIVQSNEQSEQLQKKGKDLVVGDNQNLKAIIDASEINSANLLYAFQYEVGSAVEYNPGITIVAENIKDFPGIKSGSEYLFHTKRLLQQTKLQTQIDKESTLEAIDKQEFYTMNCAIDYMGITIQQKYYSTIIKGFALSFIISYTTEDQKSELLNSIHSINFKK